MSSSEASWSDFQEAQTPGRGPAIGLGIAFLILGVFAIGFPSIASAAVTLTVGALLVIYGGLHAVDAWRKRGSGDALPEVLLAVTGAIAGVLTLLAPGIGALSLTLVLGFYFAFDGFMRLGFSFRARSRGRRPWLIASGILSLALSALLVIGLPGTSLYALGLLFGVHALFASAMLFAAAAAVGGPSKAG